MRMVELGKVAAIERKGVDPATLPPQTPYLGLEHIERGGRIIGRDTVGGAELASTKFRFSAGHVLFGKLRPNLGKISRPDFDGVCSTDILPIRPGADLDRNYLAHYLAQPRMVAFAASRTSGANLPRLNPTVLATFPIPLPSLAEQRRLAAILDHADALRAKRRQVLAHLESLAQSIFLDMFNDGDVPRRPLADLCLVAGEYGANVPSVDPRPKLPRYVRITDITASGRLHDDARAPGGHSTDWDRYRLEDGDLVFARSGATVGKTYRYRDADGPCVFAGYLIRYRPDSNVLDPDFLFAFTHSAEYKAWVRLKQNVVAQPNINAKQYGTELKVPVPPIALQREFSSRMDAINERRQTLERASARQHELFASLQARAFRGEL